MIELLQRCEPASLQAYPFCIIGSGAAGISLAVALARRGHRVLLLEGGDWHDQPALSDAYQGQARPPHPATTDYRRQRFGGTTHLWGGRCVPLDPIDFATRGHVSGSGWPIAPQQVTTWLPQAMDYCDAGSDDFSVQSLAGRPAPMFTELPGLAPDLQERIERYSLPTDFSRKFRNELRQSERVRVVLRARCTGFEVSADGRHIASVRISDGRQQLDVAADRFVLCGGGIENARLLLAQARSVPSWSRFDASLGRFYACHYDLIFGAVAFSGEKPRFSFDKTTDGVYARRKLQFSADFLQRHRLLNSAFRLHFPPYADPGHGSGVLSTIYLAKSVLAREHRNILNHGSASAPQAPARLAHLRNVATDLGSVGGFGVEWLFKRKLATRKMPYTLVPNRNGSYPLEFNSEQVPDAGNRISLQPDCDALGMPRVAVHWKLTDTDVQSGISSFLQLQRLLASTRQCRLDFDPGELKERAAAALPVGGHHIGSTRMGRSPDDSVVDADCRMHGVDNLFVAGASVFPTSSHANPTLTLVALALRLAAHLDKVVPR